MVLLELLQKLKEISNISYTFIIVKINKKCKQCTKLCSVSVLPGNMRISRRPLKI
ncbi:hypothetical protein WH47_00032 [Habropoda laboriosa]|uniref:Uncharacterized protein n=1 Tax=Habropoda laboriosa TaxID=597456 RepID=A0A0L7QJN0_9HYME|nr:hypothetical protein WH47_00032 [Habropoda laboriosa]